MIVLGVCAVALGVILALCLTRLVRLDREHLIMTMLNREYAEMRARALNEECLSGYEVVILKNAHGEILEVTTVVMWSAPAR